MKIEDLKHFLEVRGFKVVEGEMRVRFSDEYESITPLIGVEVSASHRCLDPDCHGGIHTIGTSVAIEFMTEQALRAMLNEELLFNR